MQRIRIKKAPVKGDQRDYSLYDKTTLNPNYQDSSTGIQNTMGPVDRDKATIEVERGEVVIGDTNKDGFLELFTFTGKPHSQGGTPVDIPEGSFIFSNTKKLRIKDEQLLQSQFNLPMKKGGWTPAEIAKKYQINEYIADLKSQDADNLTKRSSDEMLKKNMEKLGILALIQESMKGFPDGIPAISESVLAGMIGNPQMATQLNGQLGMSPAQPPRPATPQELYQQSQQQAMMQQQGQMPPQEMQETPQQEMMEPEQEPASKEMPMQRYGGLARFVTAGPVKKQNPAFPDMSQMMGLNKPGQPVATNVPYFAPRPTPVAGGRNLLPQTAFTSKPVTPQEASLPITFDDVKSAFNTAAVLPISTAAAVVSKLSNSGTSSSAKQPTATKQEVSNVGVTYNNAQKIIENYQKQYEAAKAEGNYQKMNEIGTAMINYSKIIDEHHQNTPWYSMGWMYGSDENAYNSLAGITNLTGNKYMMEAANIERTANIEKDMQELIPVALEIQKRVNANDPNVTADEYKKLEKISKMYKSWNQIRQYDNNKKAFVPESTSMGWTPASLVGPDASVYSYLSDLENKLNNFNGSNTTEVALEKEKERKKNKLGTATADYSDTFDMLSVPVVKQTFDNQEAASTPAPTPAQIPAQTTPSQQTAPKQRTAPAVHTSQNVLDEYAIGGSLPRYDGAGPVTETKTNPLVLAQKPADAVTTKPDPNALVKIDEKEIVDQNGQKVKVDIFTKGDMVYAIDANGNTISSKKRSEYNNYNNSQYGDERIQKILNQAKNVDYSGVNFGEFGTQRQNPNSGVYVQSNDSAYRKKNDLTPEEWADFQRRHGSWIDSQHYKSFAGNGDGFEAFKKDLMTSPTVGNKAADWFQKQVNVYSRNKFGEDYFTDDNTSAYSHDSKFGRITYSTPRFWDDETIPETHIDPEMDTAYYCVKDENGQGSVQTVSFKKGEQPTPPAGNATRYFSAEDATANCGGKPPEEKLKQMFYCIKGNNNISSIVTVSYKEGEQPTPPPGAVAAYETQEAADAGCSSPEKHKNSGWFLQDINNYTGAMTDQINRYEPALEQIYAKTPGYVLLDPTRQLAANQSDMASYRNMAQNSTAGNVASASALGASGEGFNNAANVIANVENQNVGIVNNAAANNAQIWNAADLANANARQSYVSQMATLNQQLDNSKNLRKWRQIAAFNNGATNAMRNKMNEQVLFPGVHINTITGDTEFSGHGFNPLLPSFYTNPYTNAKGGSDYSSEDILKMTSQAYNNAKSGYLKQGMSEKEATKMAEKHAASVQQLYFSKAGKNNSAYDNFANAMSNGTMLPGAFNYGQYSTE